MTSLVSQFQSRVYDPAKVRPVGIWQLVGGVDSVSMLNRCVGIIDPVRSRMQKAAGEWPHPAWKPKQGEPFWESWRLICESWDEWAQLNLPQAIDWLAPNWLNPRVGQTTATADGPHPAILFHAPHGKCPESFMGGNMDFDSRGVADRDGLTHLTNGFGELCNRLHAVGITPIIHDGSPTNDVWRGYRFPRAVIGLDAAPIYDLKGVVGECARYMQKDGDGVGIEGVCPKDDTRAREWYDQTDYQFHSIFDNDAEKVVPGMQKPWAVGRFPLAGTSEFTQVYGDRYWFFQLYTGSFGLKWPENGFASEPDAKAYLTAYAAKCKWLRTLFPKCVVLLEHRLAMLCGRWKFGVENFA